MYEKTHLASNHIYRKEQILVSHASLELLYRKIIFNVSPGLGYGERMEKCSNKWEKEGEVILQMFMIVSKCFIIMLFEYTSGGRWFNFG